jgi:hypothetical protein
MDLKYFFCYNLLEFHPKSPSVLVKLLSLRTNLLSLK